MKEFDLIFEDKEGKTGKRAKVKNINLNNKFEWKEENKDEK